MLTIQMFHNIFLCQFFALFVVAWDPAKPLPSCLTSDLTWDQSDIFDVVLNCQSPDDCQAICANTDNCHSFTWLSAESPVFPLGCGLFSLTGAELPCDHCVSGARECPCTVKGECDSMGDNMIEAFPQIPTATECRNICEENALCSQYTYFEESHLTNLCLLFSTCDTLNEECDGCVTGSPGCEMCSFENTVDGQCEECDHDWTAFGGHCYRLLDNSGLQYLDKDGCTKECQEAGGNLTSIHSSEENDFLASILRTSRSDFGEQTTFIGAELLGGSFGWTDGTIWDFSNWHDGEPNNGAEGGCVSLGFDPSVPDQWYDWPCAMNVGFDCICKK